MAERTEPLLEKVYYENCPGCRLDEQKDANPGIPYKNFCYIWLISFTAGLPITSAFPYLYFMIRDLRIAKVVEDIGFYAGFVGSSFFVGRALTAVPWGMVSDRYGRKPVIMIGLASVIVCSLAFGLSTTYWMAITARFLLGALNGIFGPIKAFAAEVCRPEHQSTALSLVRT